MISLIDILNEADFSSSKAIFLSGSSGSGKSYIIKQLNLKGFSIINVDDTYEELLKQSGIGLKQKDFTPDQLSLASQLMAKAQKATKEKYKTTLKQKNNLILDGTGGSSKALLKKKHELESLGYETFMVMVYTSPITSLERNMTRNRSLMPSIVLRTWRDVNHNIQLYREKFSPNFVLINNTPDGDIEDFSQESIKKYFLDSKAKGKPKSPEEKKRSLEQINQLYDDIKSLLKQTPKFDSLETAKQKINKFLW